MITAYFGVPGCGKTTLLTMIAQKELRKIDKGQSPYKHVMTNFYCQGCETVDLKKLGQFIPEDALILLDEITLDADSRDFKSFSQYQKLFWILHRHVGCDIIYFCQDFSRVDKTIRNLTYDLWYCQKSVFPIFKEFTTCQRIWRNININEYSNELTLGYRFSNLRERLFTKSRKVLFRKPWYKYFDSYDKGELANQPEYEYTLWEG